MPMNRFTAEAEKGRIKAEFFFHFSPGKKRTGFFKANKIHLLWNHQFLAHLLRGDITTTLKPNANDFKPEDHSGENFILGLERYV